MKEKLQTQTVPTKNEGVQAVLQGSHQPLPGSDPSQLLLRHQKAFGPKSTFQSTVDPTLTHSVTSDSLTLSLSLFLSLLGSSNAVGGLHAPIFIHGEIRHTAVPLAPAVRDLQRQMGSTWSERSRHKLDMFKT